MCDCYHVGSIAVLTLPNPHYMYEAITLMRQNRLEFCLKCDHGYTAVCHAVASHPEVMKMSVVVVGISR